MSSYLVVEGLSAVSYHAPGAPNDRAAQELQHRVARKQRIPALPQAGVFLEQRSQKDTLFLTVCEPA